MSLGAGWYYNSLTGSVVDEPPLVGIPQSWFPDWHGPFPTKAAALTYASQQAAAGTGAAATGIPGNIANEATGAAQAATSGLSSGLAQGLRALLPQGTQLRAFMVRVLKVVVGLALVVVGVIQLVQPERAVTTVVRGAVSAL